MDGALNILLFPLPGKKYVTPTVCLRAHTESSLCPLAQPETPPRFDIRRDMAEYIRRVSLSEIFKQASHHIQFLSDEELEGNDESGLPIFLFHYPNQSDDFFYSDPSEAFHPADPVSFLPFFAQMACYSGDEIDLEPSIAAILVSTPGCLLRR